MSSREHDIILWGATGFTGGLVAEYFAKNAGNGIKWALAGRSRERLEKVKSKLVSLNPDLDSLPLVIADSGDMESVESMTSSTRVVLSTVGPFIKYGTPVVEACLKSRTHYCDITGESPWVKSLIDNYHNEAAEKGVHIVPFCGFDSVPFDIGVLMMAKAAEKHGGLKHVSGLVSSNGRPSGGTAHTILNLMATVPLKDIQDVHLLTPAEHKKERIPAGGADQMTPKYNSDARSWTAPFVMSGVNTRVVRRSQYLRQDAGQPYGPPSEFYYSESERKSSVVSAYITSFFLGLFSVALLFGFTRSLLAKVLPAPGDGPDKETRDKSYFVVDFYGECVDGKRLKGIVSGGDPGYSETSKMLSECALCLASQEAQLFLRGGVLTPASSMGELLIDRLRAASMKLEVSEE